MNLKPLGIKLRNWSQSNKSGLVLNQKVFGNNEDTSSGFNFSPVATCIQNGSGRKNRFTAASPLIPISSSGPISPSRDISVFSPIFFGTGIFLLCFLFFLQIISNSSNFL